MARHPSPDPYATDAARARRRGRRRTVAIATALVVGVATGAGVAARSGLLSFAGSCEDDAVRVDVLAAPDIAPALDEAADRAREQDVKSDGRCLDVRVEAKEPHQVAGALQKSDEARFDVWVPDSELWVDRASLGDSTALTPAGNVAASPVTMGMVPSAAKAVGWPKKRYTWAELTELATEGDKLRLGAADPARSAGGLLALTKIGASAAKTDGPESDTQVAATAKLLAQRTSDSESRALATVARDDSGTEQGDPRRNQALIVSEQAAFRHNQEAGADGQLELFYPKDGAPQLDYPYTLVDESHMSTDESRAALRFMTLLGEEDSRSLLEKHGFRSGSEEPSEELVTAAGGSEPQPYATASAEPPTPKELQATLGMWTITVQSARLTTVVDVSTSMGRIVPNRGESRLEVTKSSLVQALSQFTPEDEIGVWEFATYLDGTRDYRKLVETRRLGASTGNGATQRERLVAAYDALHTKPGYTGLYDTSLAAYKDAQKSYVKGKFNALVILTDGANQDPGSLSRRALIDELERLADPKRPVRLIAIAVGPDADRKEVKQIAAATGGSGYQIDDPAQMQEVILKAIIAAGGN
ncbi:substrate-binding and VWA domain-containing protein [Streptomyces cavernicola]|uniref:Substrate-binding and VWA domain-containing protein n=1 Tax=Streptomyces cavernicola TaxID=3043613 RepID=A0ABT6SJS1_9ACTN|nr:substrate-binding and VWA domain-containing protein [Streptomyces sp. B-S-A6]MDI3407501.1 substrate-binding and VWA domain-containing protein [Streptomyces sp. B-S-A6]